MSEADIKTNDIQKKTIQGIFWSFNSKFIVQLFNFLVTAALARLLLPEHFGVVGMSLIIVSLMSVINDTGFSSALIQRKDLSDSHIYTAFWTIIVISFFLFVVSFLASTFVADFFRNDLVEDLIKVASLTFLLSAPTIVHRSLLTRNLKFKTLAMTEMIGSVLSGSIAVYLALLGFGPWSLVARTLLNDFFVVSLTIIVYPWKPMMRFSKKSFFELFGFSYNVISSNLLSSLRQNMDHIIIGRFMGAELLGYYTIAYSLASLPSKKIAPIISRVIFPVFSLLQNRNAHYKKGYLKIVSFLSLITSPILIGLAAIAPELITLIYGEKWVPSIIPLQILCLLGIINTMSHSSGSIFYSKGAPEIELNINLMKLPTLTIAIIIGSFFGIIGVAVATTLVSFFYFIYTQNIINSLINSSWNEYFSFVKVSLLGSLGMGFIIAAYRQVVILLGNYNSIFLLITSIIIGSCFYLFIILRNEPENITYIAGNITNIFNKRTQ